MPTELLDSSQTTFKQSKKQIFWTQKWSKEGQNLILGPFNFGSHVSTFRAENTPQSEPFKVKNNP